MIVEDFFFYWGHRILHLKSLYPYIHKLHHEYNYPISISAENAHWVEFIIANLIPTSAGLN
jgi:sterol desaturase/sphingolipid hydroxylase (fatty acid hydroxylase superfamily)